MESSDPSQIGPEHAVVARIDALIRKIPYETFADLGRKSQGLDAIHAEVLRQRADEAVDRLELEAWLGDESAVKALREIGIRVAEILAILMGKPGDPVDRFLETREAGTPDEIFLENEEEGSNVSLQALVDEVEQLSPASIRACLDLLRGTPHADFPVIREDLVRDDSGDTSVEGSLGQIPPVQQAEAVGGNPTPGRRDPLTTFEELEALMDAAEAVDPDILNFSKHLKNKGGSPAPDPMDILRVLLGRRALVVGRLTAQKVAGASIWWPISVFALGEGRKNGVEEYVASLGLGSSFSVRFALKPGRGGSRDDSGSAMGFALPIYLALEDEREKAKASEGLLEALRQEEEECLRGGKGRWMKWKRMAALLPDLSENDDDLQQWIEAGKAHCEHLCSGDWVSYQWARCVRNRPGKNPEAAVREMLEVGLKSLVGAVS